MLPVLRPCQEEWHLIRQREPIHFLNSLQVQSMGTQCFNKQWGERNSNMLQCRLNTSDSCPPGKFRVRVRTRRVRDQVAGTQTRQPFSPTLQGACLTEKRGKDRGRGRVFKTDRRKSKAVRQGRSEKVARPANKPGEGKGIRQYLCHCCSPLCRDNPCRKHQSVACLLSPCRSPVKQSGVGKHSSQGANRLIA